MKIYAEAAMETWYLLRVHVRCPVGTSYCKTQNWIDQPRQSCESQHNPFLRITGCVEIPSAKSQGQDHKKNAKQVHDLLTMKSPPHVSAVNPKGQTRLRLKITYKNFAKTFNIDFSQWESPSENHESTFAWYKSRSGLGRFSWESSHENNNRLLSIRLAIVILLEC